MTVTERVAYLRGLTEGLGIDDSSKEGRVIKEMLEVLDDIALTVTDLEDNMAELSEQVDAIDEDLEGLEEIVYDEDDDDECDCCCDDDEFDDGDLYEVTCPKCGDEVYVTEDILDDGSIECPNCGELLEFDFETEDGCDCGCGHDSGCDCDK
ncbi:hypothetical protein H8711_00995 [Clostridiaceae bacterium NSJ-31]|uniref:TFIIB-type domain-containing protein n=1 Tax=Ligaoa zhengdingensis TaxID=2763658 RepID=A0A926DUE8_9FIRM|nr:CD1247 N-terminal domain-containing protein [Ligaoa zhengdingensis]MBC8545513.1 hypothetical protein [Ligaoa zhengdingensis]